MWEGVVLWLSVRVATNDVIGIGGWALFFTFGAMRRCAGRFWIGWGNSGRLALSEAHELEPQKGYASTGVAVRGFLTPASPPLHLDPMERGLRARSSASLTLGRGSYPGSGPPETPGVGRKLPPALEKPSPGPRRDCHGS